VSELFPSSAIGLAVLLTFSNAVQAQTDPAATRSLKEIQVIDFRGEQLDSLK
jgi:hypothetical protein